MIVQMPDHAVLQIPPNAKQKSVIYKQRTILSKKRKEKKRKEKDVLKQMTL